MNGPASTMLIVSMTARETPTALSKAAKPMSQKINQTRTKRARLYPTKPKRKRKAVNSGEPG